VVRQTLIIVITSIILTQIATFSTSIYLHRTLAHRALSLHPIVELLFRAALWLVTGQDRQQWVAVHRKHHTFTDREGDPHSPLLLGFWKVQLGNVFYYVQEARYPQSVG
jgi:stearoyl-CoA desaturase (delta-9 desaturase)